MAVQLDGGVWSRQRAGWSGILETKKMLVSHKREDETVW
jgi:hypothetical protein